MDKFVRWSLAVVLVLFAEAITAPVQAASNPAIDALQQTPVSLFTYGIDAMGAGVTGAIGEGKTPPSFAMFKAPLSGKIADLATILYDADAGTITVNIVLIDKVDVSDATSADEVCNQGMGLLRLLAQLDPATGQLQAGMKNSGFADYFSATGTPVKSPADDFVTLDKAFQLRYVFNTDVGHFECVAPLFGATHILKKMAY